MLDLDLHWERLEVMVVGLTITMLGDVSLGVLVVGRLIPYVLHPWISSSKVFFELVYEYFYIKSTLDIYKNPS